MNVFAGCDGIPKKVNIHPLPPKAGAIRVSCNCTNGIGDSLEGNQLIAWFRCVFLNHFVPVMLIDNRSRLEFCAGIFFFPSWSRY
jgi:hypothetical protein